MRRVLGFIFIYSILTLLFTLCRIFIFGVALSFTVTFTFTFTFSKIQLCPATVDEGSTDYRGKVLPPFHNLPQETLMVEGHSMFFEI